jgi:hypothetical protein
LAILSVFALVGAPQVANAAAASWNGVWDGTIGDLPVRACLQHNDYGDFGAYYYHRHLSIITLGAAAPAPKAGETTRWTEDPNNQENGKGAIWSITSGASDQLSGTWAQNGKSLPLRLQRIATPTDDDTNACGTAQFSALRAIKPKIKSAPGQFERRPIREFTADVGKHLDVEISSFALPGDSPALRKVNAELLSSLPRDAAGSDYMDCTQNNLGSIGYDGDYRSNDHPVLITRTWMVDVRDVSYTCGGAHPDAYSSYRVWNLESGEVADLWSWMAPAAATTTVEHSGTKDAYSIHKIGPALRKQLVKRWSRDDEDCSSVAAETDDWQVYVTRGGLTFSPQLPHVINACTEEVVIPFSQAGKLLTGPGRAALASVAADIARSPAPKTKP